MVQMRQRVQFEYRIYNTEIEPEHETEAPCYCGICQYAQRKRLRVEVQRLWAKAVMYPGDWVFYYMEQIPKGTCWRDDQMLTLALLFQASHSTVVSRVLRYSM